MAGLSLGRGMRQLAAATVISLVAIALVIGAHLWQMRGEIEGVGRTQMASVAVFLAFEANRQFTVAQLIAADAMQAWKAGGIRVKGTRPSVLRFSTACAMTRRYGRSC